MLSMNIMKELFGLYPHQQGITCIPNENLPITVRMIELPQVTGVQPLTNIMTKIIPKAFAGLKILTYRTKCKYSTIVTIRNIPLGKPRTCKSYISATPGHCSTLN